MTETLLLPKPELLYQFFVTGFGLLFIPTATVVARALALSSKVNHERNIKRVGELQNQCERGRETTNSFDKFL